ncbi:MAG: D-ornithine 4,5-aminomutase subunit OraE [Candidatus Izemoplasmatales bacterium]|jgi:D-ornithine 4,5-aminomutase subunit beta|nr:D-ornithine 4,5-aminomutase subunit OraE [Candidatus Izemoplasmatales bacterium]MDD4595845.1 D-ornithine 4,5-aminomutase subunit OraE [Candidatus Izemoplasmatales bacterium]
MILPNEKLNLKNILSNLENYAPRRHNWTWRKPLPHLHLGTYDYSDTSEPLKNSVPPMASKSFGFIDPQPREVITTEIASGRFEDDIRRMRMAAWHGADHIMVIRTAGQSHFDGLIEGTPQGIGGVPITRKQIRATRKALDMIEDEVGRPINFHSYVSGVAGPEIAVMYAEEGVNGAHQDPQYNVLYRNINMIRSFVDAAESKRIMAGARMLQIDGAHNANATAKEAWKVMPELLVQHAINCAFSVNVGMEKTNIALSTVPPTASPAPDLKVNLPYAVALRDFFTGYRMRAQMNTKYMESSTREATVTHVLNMMISKLTSADIQSTITPDEGRNVPWHMYNIEACDTARQALIGMDGMADLVEVRKDGYMQSKVREIKERAVLFLEEMLETGGYFQAVENGFFIDSGIFPERNGDGISRKINGGIGANTVFERDTDYFAPVPSHFGYNNVKQYGIGRNENPASVIGGSTFEDRRKIQYIDELDPIDNVETRMAENKRYQNGNLIRPEVQWQGDGVVVVDLTLPTSGQIAMAAALEIGKRMNLKDVEVIHKEILHPAEGTRIQIKGQVDFDIDITTLTVPKIPVVLSDAEITAFVKIHPIKIVAATVGEDEHSVGLREIIDIKHGGIEQYGITCNYLGTSVPIDKLVDAAIEINADAILLSTIISHDDIHYKNMKKINDYAIEKGIRDRIIIIAGGTQVTPEMAVKQGIDAGFGRGTKGVQVATFLVNRLRGSEKL